MPKPRQILIGSFADPVEFIAPRGLKQVLFTENSDGYPITFKSVSVKGNKNHAFVGADADLSELRINIKGRSNTIYIGKNCRLKGTINITGSSSVVVIGAETTFNNVKMFCNMSQNIFIGKDCMFSSGIEIRTSDSHSVVSLDDYRRVNAPCGVYVGHHVWVGKGVTLQRGCWISDDNIIGMGSFVKGVYPTSNNVIAGTPAKLVKSRVTWDRRELPGDSPQTLLDWPSYDLM